MKYWTFCFLFILNFLSAAEFHFKDRLEKGSQGDYFVFEANKTATLIAIRSISPAKIRLEEISVPSSKIPSSWPQWIQSKAPGHTSWSMIEIDLVNGVPLDCYSFSRSAWIQISQKESLLATLLHLSLHPIESDRRRRIGPSPLPGERDHRKFWNPPFIVEGRKKENAAFDVFETDWPEDGTELSGKTVSLYFDQEKKFPFPFWIQIETTHATGALRAIDCGKNLPSSHRSMPRHFN